MYVICKVRINEEGTGFTLSGTAAPVERGTLTEASNLVNEAVERNPKTSWGIFKLVEVRQHIRQRRQK